MIDVRAMLPIFSSVFLAELGDKTQIATLTFVAAGAAGRWEVFMASSLALVLCTLLGVLAGDLIGRFVSPALLKTIAGILLILMGGWSVFQGLRA
ncbi:MAG: TMEM165/GDT1 family protein [Deltaproteobacteria bacterium]|nr:TMEM165/GDT1 family protein [Deltaproteobacteria bacterium]